MVTQLEKVFDELTWDQKFLNSVPKYNIVYVFREGDDLKKIKRLKEETNKGGFRSAHLGSDSLGQILVICEERLD
jgi:hypothetical protein